MDAVAPNESARERKRLGLMPDHQVTVQIAVNRLVTLLGRRRVSIMLGLSMADVSRLRAGDADLQPGGSVMRRVALGYFCVVAARLESQAEAQRWFTEKCWDLASPEAPLVAIRRGLIVDVEEAAKAYGRRKGGG